MVRLFIFQWPGHLGGDHLVVPLYVSLGSYLVEESACSLLAVKNIGQGDIDHGLISPIVLSNRVRVA